MFPLMADATCIMWPAVVRSRLAASAQLARRGRVVVRSLSSIVTVLVPAGLLAYYFTIPPVQLTSRRKVLQRRPEVTVVLSVVRSRARVSVSVLTLHIIPFVLLAFAFLRVARVVVTVLLSICPMAVRTSSVAHPLVLVINVPILVVKLVRFVVLTHLRAKPLVYRQPLAGPLVPMLTLILFTLLMMENLIEQCPTLAMAARVRLVKRSVFARVVFPPAASLSLARRTRSVVVVR